MITRRLDLEMDVDGYAKLEKLREITTSHNMAHVIQKALCVYDFLWQQKVMGNKAIVMTKVEGRDEPEPRELDLR